MPRFLGYSVAMVWLLLAGMLAATCGCGGSGGQAGAGPGVSQVGSTPFYFQVDLKSGKVISLAPDDPRAADLREVTPQLIGLNPTTGTAPLKLTTSALLRDFPGNPGRRALNVKVANNCPDTVGALPGGQVTGLDVIIHALVFKDASAKVLPGGSVENAYDYPQNEKGVFYLGQTLEPAEKSPDILVVIMVPAGAATALISAYVRADGAMEGTYPQPGAGCYVSTVAGDGVAGWRDGLAHFAQFQGLNSLCVGLDGQIVIADSDPATMGYPLRELYAGGTRVRVVNLSRFMAGTSPRDIAIDQVRSTATNQLLYLTGVDNDPVWRRPGGVYCVRRNPQTNSASSFQDVVEYDDYGYPNYYTRYAEQIAGQGTDKDAKIASALDLGKSMLALAPEVTESGGLWIADSDPAWQRVYEIRPAPLTDPGAVGCPRLVTVNETRIPDPRDVAVDAQGNAFVVSGSANALFRRSVSGRLTKIPIATAGGQLCACAVNRAGSLCYVKTAISNRIIMVQLHGADPVAVSSWKAQALTGGGTGYADGPGATAKFRFNDAGMALDAAGTLFVTDRGNFCVRRIDRPAQN